MTTQGNAGTPVPGAALPVATVRITFVRAWSAPNGTNVRPGAVAEVPAAWANYLVGQGTARRGGTVTPEFAHYSAPSELGLDTAQPPV